MDVLRGGGGVLITGGGFAAAVALVGDRVSALTVNRRQRHGWEIDAARAQPSDPRSRSGVLLSDVDDLETASSRRAEDLEVGPVRGHDRAAAAHRGLGHGGVDRTHRVGDAAPKCASPPGELG